MTRGRKPDPSRENRGTGNRPAQGSRAKPTAQVAKVERFPPPKSLPAQMHQVWRVIVEDLGDVNHMRPSYLPTIEAYCQAIYVHAVASENIVQFGLVVVDEERGPRPNPHVKMQKDAAATILRFADALGMTPAGRIRLGLMEVVGASLLGTIAQELNNRRA